MKKMVIGIFISMGLLLFNCTKTSTNKIVLSNCSDIEFTRLTFLFYLDLDGCFFCAANLGGIEKFIASIKEKFDVNCFVIIGSKPEFANTIIAQTRFPYKVFIDERNSFSKCNNIEFYDYKKNCYLIDNENKILWQGNPIRSRKDKKDVISFLSDLLSVELQDIISNETIDLGTFNWQIAQSTTFSIHNTGNEPMLIDTLYTSCECTTAEIDKYSIEPTDSAIVSATIKAEKPAQFMREVYVGVRGKEQIVLSIEGEAVEK